MKKITQQHPAGCGIACVAAVLGISYEEASLLFDKPEYACARGYYCREIVKALRRGCKEYMHAYVKPSKKHLLQRPNTIVYIKKSTRYPLGHYLAHDKKKGWMNPWINFPRIDPARSGWNKRLPGEAQYIIYPAEE